MDEVAFLPLIDKIYQASTDADSAADLASAFASVFESDSCLVYFCQRVSAAMPEVSGILSRTENFTDQEISSYVDYYHDRNVWYERAWRKGTPAIVLGQELIDTPSLLRTEWSDFLRATDTLHVLGVQYHIAGDSLGLIGVHRSPRYDPFDESDRRKMAQLLPHMQRAMQIRERLGLAEHRGVLSLDLLDKLSVALLLVAADSSVVFANATADKLLRRRHGLAIHHGKLRPRFAGDGPAFDCLVAETARASVGIGAGSGGVFYLTLPFGKKLPALIVPMRMTCSEMNPIQPVAAVIISGPDPDKRGCESYFSQQYGLTPAESKLLLALAGGQELSEYAEAEAIGISTVKTHLKHLFTKTGCHRQAELVRKVLADPLLSLIPGNSPSR